MGALVRTEDVTAFHERAEWIASSHDQADWLRQRRTMLTASDVAAVMGEDEHQSAVGVYVDKRMEAEQGRLPHKRDRARWNEMVDQRDREIVRLQGICDALAQKANPKPRIEISCACGKRIHHADYDQLELLSESVMQIEVRACSRCRGPVERRKLTKLQE